MLPKRILACLSVAVVAAPLTACGDDSSMPASADDQRAPRPEGYAAFVVPDVSGSTRDVRGLYQRTFVTFATAAGNDGSGKLYLIAASGDGEGERAPLQTNVAPENPDNPAYADAEVAQAVERAKQGFGDLLVDPDLSYRGSPIVEAAARAARLTHRGDRLLIVSDGIQASDLTGDFHDVDLSDTGIGRLLDRIEAAELLPDLSGVTVHMPVLLIHPGGIGLDTAKQAQVRAFWVAWARRTNAQFDPKPLSGG